ncbi:hypothetical protein [Sporosarcina sp. FSL K6-3457]|uniref:hypothetical protein n=1 Tax=Sporosarcina sp. FSL K6-3457 TaxID=2978204 RepID=UPI0030F7B61C
MIEQENYLSEFSKSPPSMKNWMDIIKLFIQSESKLLLNPDKASGGCHGFLGELFERARKKSGHNHAGGVIDMTEEKGDYYASCYIRF